MNPLLKVGFGTNVFDHNLDQRQGKQILQRNRKFVFPPGFLVRLGA
jgi:hypothetical protein